MKKPEMYHPGVEMDTIGIKNHMERDCGGLDSSDMLYLGGQDPGQYAKKQNDALAANVRKHAAK